MNKPPIQIPGMSKGRLYFFLSLSISLFCCCCCDLIWFPIVVNLNRSEDESLNDYESCSPSEEDTNNQSGNWQGVIRYTDKEEEYLET